MFRNDRDISFHRYVFFLLCKYCENRFARQDGTRATVCVFVCRLKMLKNKNVQLSANSMTDREIIAVIKSHFDIE